MGIEPYFERPDSERPEYIEFRLGDYQHELGIIDSKYSPMMAGTVKKGNLVIVDTLKRLLETKA